MVNKDNFLNIDIYSSTRKKSKIKNYWPKYRKEEINAVRKVLKTGRVNYWTGDECQKFENEFSRFIGTKYAIAVANGSVALELALYGLDIGPGDEILVPTRTFVASASCVVLRGAKPVFVDIDLNSQNMTRNTLNNSLTNKTRAIIAVHLAGWPCDMDELIKFSRAHKLKVIEDCAQSHGAKYKNRYAGSFGDVAAYSFCQDKIISTGGEGGMLLTNNKKIWEKAWSYKDHGKNYKKLTKHKNTVRYNYVHDTTGTNWRMTEIQAAIGRVQLKNLNNWVDLRNRNARYIIEKIKNIKSLRIPVPPSDIRHAYYKLYVFVRNEYLKKEWSRDKIINAINNEGVPCYSGACPEVHLEKAFKNECSADKYYLPNSKVLGKTSLMFLVHPTLTIKELNNTSKTIINVMKAASK